MISRTLLSLSCKKGGRDLIRTHEVAFLRYCFDSIRWNMFMSVELSKMTFQNLFFFKYINMYTFLKMTIPLYVSFLSSNFSLCPAVRVYLSSSSSSSSLSSDVSASSTPFSFILSSFTCVFNLSSSLV